LESRARQRIRRKLETTQPSYTFKDPYKSIKHGLKFENERIAKLNLNENFFIPREKLLQIIAEALEDLDPRLYPQDEEEKASREDL
jgi:histidinol-phosphate/aromatic aminotransferase/cobyric acid decarboxylase-like protein